LQRLQRWIWRRVSFVEVAHDASNVGFGFVGMLNPSANNMAAPLPWKVGRTLLENINFAIP
jgi:hypothetical protein